MRTRSARSSRISAKVTLLGAALACALAGGAGGAEVTAPASAAYAPDQIVVRLHPEASRVANGAIGRGFEAQTGRAAQRSLDELCSRYGARKFRRVFRRLEDGKGRLVRTARDSVRAQLLRRGATAAVAEARSARAAELENVFVLELATGSDLRQVVAAFRQNENVVWAEPNWFYRISAEPLPELPFVPDDRYVTQDRLSWSQGAFGQVFPDLYGLRNTRAIEGWNALDADGSDSFDPGEKAPGEGIVVAVIDSGVDARHPDLASRLWVNPGEVPGNGVDDDGNGYVDDVSGWDFFDGDADPSDPNGHGTHVAGTIAARTGNAIGVAGMAPSASILPLRGLGADGFGPATALAAAVEYATAVGADITSNSWGGTLTSELLADAFATAEAAGVLSVAAAGNDDSDVSSQSPANLDSVMAVAAVDFRDVRAGFSNTGMLVGISAPGVQVLSLNANAGDNAIARSAPENQVDVDYIELSGTSMACPHVSGAAAVLMSAFPAESAQEIRGRLMAGSRTIDAENPGFQGRLGAGRLDLQASLAAVPAPLFRLQGPTARNFLAGQQAEVSVGLRNFWAPAEGVTALLSTSHPNARVDRGSVVFGRLDTGQSVRNELDPFLVSLDPTTPFGRIPFTLSVSVPGAAPTLFEFTLSLSFMSDVSDLAGVTRIGLLPVFSVFQDYSGDGWPDILMADLLFEVFLYRNRGNATFVRRNAEAGVPRDYNAWTSQFVDIDNDGDRDILIGGIPRDGSFLLLNRGDGTTIDVSDSSGIGSLGLDWSAALDYDGDGWIDLLGGQGDPPEGQMYLLQNQGDLTFVDRRAASGLPAFPFLLSGIGRVATLDYDGDGDPDVLFAGYRSGFSLWRNEGDGTFTDATATAFAAFRPPSVSGIALGDCDGDGDLDLFMSDLPMEIDPPSRILINEGGRFHDAGDAAGDIVAYNLTALWWGNAFFDVDNDGDLDLFVSKDVAYPGTALPALDHNALFRNEGSCRFTRIDDEAFPAEFATLGGAASLADYDRDGDVDVYTPGSRIFARSGALLRNELGDESHWLAVALQGTASPRDGYGARVTLEAGGRLQMREVRSDPLDPSLIHFGLGSESRAERLEVRWPSGIREVFHDVAADQTFRVVEVECGAASDRDGDGVCDPLEIAIDVRPGSARNPLNPSSRGSIPVALLGSDGFDVGNVDPSTLAFGPGGVAPRLGMPERLEDVNADGRLDRISYFAIQGTGIGPGDTAVCVTGALRDGTAFEGCDAVHVIPAAGAGPRARQSR